jgi:hypothetical protein
MRDLEGTRMMREGWADPGQTNRNKTKNKLLEGMVGTRGEMEDGEDGARLFFLNNGNAY